MRFSWVKLHAENDIHIFKYADPRNHIYVQDLSSNNLVCNGKNALEGDLFRQYANDRKI